MMPRQVSTIAGTRFALPTSFGFHSARAPTHCAAPSRVDLSKASSGARMTSNNNCVTSTRWGLITWTGVWASSVKQSRKDPKTASSFDCAASLATAVIGGTRSRNSNASSSVDSVATKEQHARKAATATDRSASERADRKRAAKSPRRSLKCDATVSDNCNNKIYASSRRAGLASAAQVEINCSSSGHLPPGTKTLAKALASAATDLRTALSGSWASRSSNFALTSACVAFFNLGHNFTIFFRSTTAAIWRTAGPFRASPSTATKTPTTLAFFSRGFKAPSASRIVSLDGCSKPTKISSIPCTSDARTILFLTLVHVHVGVCCCPSQSVHANAEVHAAD
mmetsp:Transcript_30253/g.97540  ORF Transcript_30253/g.97540 Transcript_30253/m.97540 type:complete len:339 (+) Transcript_30253:1136-2152(+)